MIPFDRPIYGSDLEEMRQERTWSVADALWVFGLSMPKWSLIVRKGRKQPVPTTLAIIVRFLDTYPEIEIIPKMPRAYDIWQLLRSIDDSINMRIFSLMLGKEASGGYRWLTLGGGQVPSRERLFLCLQMLLSSAEETTRPALLAKFQEMVTREAESRGAKDIFQIGSWTPGKPKRVRKSKKEISASGNKQDEV